MKSARALACMFSCIISMTAHAQNVSEPTLQTELRNGSEIIATGTALTCSQVSELSNSAQIQKSFNFIDNHQEYFSREELESFREICRVYLSEQAQRSMIYDNCIIYNSRGVDSSAMRNVRSLCERVSENPTWLQRLRWGN